MVVVLGGEAELDVAPKRMEIQIEIFFLFSFDNVNVNSGDTDCQDAKYWRQLYRAH
jgi:hypothetical protein